MKIIGISGMRDMLDTFIFVVEEDKSITYLNCTNRINDMRRLSVNSKEHNNSFIRRNISNSGYIFYYKYCKDYDTIIMTTEAGIDIVEDITSKNRINKAKSLILGVQPEIKLTDNSDYLFFKNDDKHFIAVIPKCDIFKISDKDVVEMDKDNMRNMIDIKSLVAINSTQNFNDGKKLVLVEKHQGYNIITSLTDWVLRRMKSTTFSEAVEIDWCEKNESIIICEMGGRYIIHSITYDENYKETSEIIYFDNKDDKFEWYKSENVNMLYSF